MIKFPDTAVNMEEYDKSKGFDPLIQSERLGFVRDEMVPCEACGRANPPNRLSCLYCAADLNPLSGRSLDGLKIPSRKLEHWENGYNLVLISAETSENEEIPQVAEILSVDIADVQTILAADAPMPLARVSTDIEAVILRDRLNDRGLRCVVVPDADLDASSPPARLAAIEIGECELFFTLFNSRSVTPIPATEIILIVTGRIFHSRIDSIGKRRRGQTTTVGSITTTSDEMLIDIYTRGNPIGVRVQAVGFDSSALGAKMSKLASENMIGLIDRLVASQPNIKLVDSYADSRAALAVAWPLQEHDDSRGLQRTGFGKRGFRGVSSTNNLNQFNTFSRLHRHLE